MAFLLRFFPNSSKISLNSFSEIKLLCLLIIGSLSPFVISIRFVPFSTIYFTKFSIICEECSSNISSENLISLIASAIFSVSFKRILLLSIILLFTSSCFKLSASSEVTFDLGIPDFSSVSKIISDVTSFIFRFLLKSSCNILEKFS